MTTVMRNYINTDWKFIEGYETFYIKKAPKDAIDIELPHPARMMPYHDFKAEDYQGIFSYFKIFDAPNNLPVQLLVFEGAMLQFDAYLNGEHLGHFISGYLPVTIDISAFIKKKNNYLYIKLDSREDPTIPPFGNVVDYMTFAGIYRKVYLESHPTIYLKNVFAHASSNGDLEISFEQDNDTSFYLELLDEGKIIFTSTELKCHIDHIEPWDIDHPKLYELRLHHGQDSKTMMIGCKDIKVDEHGVYLNGKRVKIRGLNRHQTYPYVGAAAPDSMQIDDAHILKYDLGVNCVRTSHYPQDESFLDECDRIGLLVIDEIPGWQFVSKEEKWRENCKDFARRMILKERNHACLLLYGLRIDESQDDHELYSEIQQIKKELDPYTPSIGVRYFKGSELLEDVYGYNDFNFDPTYTLDKGQSYKKEKGKPKLVSEHSGHMFPTKSYDETSRRALHAYRHARMMNAAYEDDLLLGAIGWCAFDYNTHKTFGSMDHICYHGVYDIFRNPKYAGYAYASQGNKPTLFVASTLQTSDFDAALLPVAHIYSNCDQVEAYVNGSRIGFLEQDKEHFGSLPHPPFVLDDIVGDRIEEKFSKKDKKKVAKAFSYIAHHGMNNLKFSHYALLAKIMLKYHYKYPDLYQLYGKYVVGWGSDGVVYEFVGFKDGKEVLREKRGPSKDYVLKATITKNKLIYQDVYDVVRVSITCNDEFGTQIYTADDELDVEVGENLRVLGPTHMHLVGGDISIYVAGTKTKKPCKSFIKIKGRGQEIMLNVDVA